MVSRVNKVMSYDYQGFFFLFKCVLSVWCFVCMSVRAPSASSTLDSMKMDGIRHPGTGISDSRELLGVCQESNSAPLEEHQMP